MNLRQHLESRYGLQTHLSNFPPGPTKVMVLRVVRTAQYAVIGFAVAGEQALHFVGVHYPPAFWERMRERRVALIMGAWFGGSMLANALESTGAFEVYYDGRPLYSKLASGRMPQLPDIAGPLEAALFERQQQQ